MANVAEADSIVQLREFFDEQERRLDKEKWVASLDERKREESEFHDKVRTFHAGDSAAETVEQGSTRTNSSFYDSAEASFAHSRRCISKNSPGNVVLDFACGNGGNAIRAAEAGAALAIGIDISPTSVENARAVAREKGLEKNTRFYVGDCENTGLPDASVDRVICMGCLHHLDLSYAFPELRRILKPGGRIYVHEALAYNPFINLYRRLTPHLRTEFEKDHILSLREVKFARRFFSVENLRFFHFFSIFTIPFRRRSFFPKILKVADALDNVALRAWPLRYWAWQFAFELVKGNRPR